MPDRKLTSIVSYPERGMKKRHKVSNFTAEITVIVEIVPRSLLRI